MTCLISYRALFTHDLKFGSSKKLSGQTALHENSTNHTIPYTEASAFGNGGRESESSSTTHGQEEVIPLDTIHVRNEYTVRSQA